MKTLTSLPIFRRAALVLTALLWVLSCRVHAQPYIPLLSESALWNFRYTALCPSFSPAPFEYSVFLEGDTAIGGVTYSKAYRPYLLWTFGDGSICSEWQIVPVGYIGAMREDVAERKVFYIAPGEEEILLYDFTLEVGDTVHINLPAYYLPGATIAEVIAIDEVVINGNVHKRWNLGLWLSESSGVDILDMGHHIIEGIGGNFGLVNQVLPDGIDSPENKLQCWTDENALYVPADGEQQCSPILGTATERARGEGLRVYPNPTDYMVKVEIPDGWVRSDAILEIIAGNGQVVHAHPMQGSSQRQIDLGGISPGIYFVRFRSTDRSEVHKLVLH